MAFKADLCVVCQGANRAVEDAERERREREERLRHSRNPGARGIASASGRARAAQDAAAPSPLNPASHTGQKLDSFQCFVLEVLNEMSAFFNCYVGPKMFVFSLFFFQSSFRNGEGEEGEHASSSWSTCQYLLLRPDRTPGHIPHVHLTGTPDSWQCFPLAYFIFLGGGGGV